MPPILSSKKFQALIVGFIVLALVSLVPTLQPLEAHLTEIVTIIVAYILGQGLADIGKHRVPDTTIQLGQLLDEAGNVLAGTGQFELESEDEVLH